MGRLAVIERGDERLDDRGGAVEGPSVPPGLQEVGLGDVPVAMLRGLVLVRPEADREQVFPLEGGGEVDVGGGGVDRVRAEDDQGVDLPGGDVLGQLDERGGVADRVGLDRLDEGDGPVGSDAPDRLVDRDPDRVDERRLRVADEDESLALVGLQILGDGRGPTAELRRLEPFGDQRRSPFDAHLGGDGQREVGDAARLDRQAVVGRSAGVGVHRFGDVEPVHDAGFRLALRGEGPLVGRAPGGAAGEEVGLEREDHVGPVELVDRVEDLAERELGPGPGRVLGDGLVAVPLRLGHRGEEFLELSGEAGGADGLGQEPEPGPLLGPEDLDLVGDGLGEVVKGRELAVVEDGLRAVGVVEVEGRGLGEDVGRAEARGVVGVPLDLGGPPRVALDEQAGGQAADRHRRGVRIAVDRGRPARAT